MLEIVLSSTFNFNKVIMKFLKFTCSLLIVFLLFNCSNDDEVKDTVKPVIDVSNGFPVNCSKIKRGEPFTFKALFSDNVALGGYTIDIHHNFDHHTHSTQEIKECNLDPKKDPVNPFKLIKSYTIEGNPKTFNAEQTFTIDKSFDSGNYHFHIKLADEEGWSSLVGLSIYVE